MLWADKFAKQIIASGKYQPYWVDDMKTPSGRVHVGALRGVLIHHLLHRALLDQGVKATFSYVINDMDPMDAFPSYLDKKFGQYMGFPLFKIPSPKKGFANFGQYYAQEFIDVFNGLGVKPKILWSSKMYQEGKFNQVIKEALNNQAKIRALYKKISGYSKPQKWYPFQVICPKCGKVGTTEINDWDGKKVSFVCKKNLVSWAKGCGFQAKISPFDGHGKLMWKVDWAAHWKVIGVTIEAGGKDHFSAGGSHDLSGAISQQVFNYQTPFGFLYEWFLAKGGRKMSSSKGIGVSAKEVFEILPPEVLKFLLVRANYKKAINFDLEKSNTIPDLFDDYDHHLDQRSLFLPRFRDVANYLQMPSIDLKEKFKEQKGRDLTKEELKILTERVRYAKIWLEGYAPKEMVFQVSSKVPKEAKKLNKKQKKYLGQIIELLKKDWQPDKLQYELFGLAKKMKISSQKAFEAIYLALIGKTYGPKAAWLILSQKKSIIIKRLKEVAK